MPKSDIAEGLITAYRAAYYRAGSGGDTITLRVDEHSEPLSLLFAATGHRCAAFLTACNPFGAVENLEANMKACADLRNSLDRHVARPEQIIEGESIDPLGKWPAEKSFLALGLDLETSQTLGMEFGQNAIVWAGAEAIPRLILLR